MIARIFRALALLAGVVGAAPGVAEAQEYLLSVNADPATFAAAGETISVTYVITNNNPFFFSQIDSFTDTRVATIDCPTNTLPPAGGVVTCTGTYQITTADIAAGSVTNTATLDVDICGECGIETVVASATTTSVAPPPVPQTASIRIIQRAIGGNGSFSFVSTLGSFSLSTVNGEASTSFSDLAPGTYTVTQTGQPALWLLSSLSCSGDNGGAPVTVNQGAGQASIGLDAGEAITCIFENLFDQAGHQLVTQTAISRFISQRAGFLITEGPDRPRILRRNPGYGWQQQQQPPSGGTFGFTGQADAAGSRLMLAAGMNDLAAGVPQSRATVSNALHDRMFGYAAEEGSAAVSASEGQGASTNTFAADPGVSAFDIWIEGHRMLFESSLNGRNGEGSFSVVYLGADYLVTPDFLIGALVQFDWMDEEIASLSQTVSGSGYMAGPYVSMRLSQNIFFDARVAWGESENTISPYGFYTDNFGTDRFLAHAKLSGNWNPVTDVRVTPSVSFDYVEENQHSYVDSLGVLIGSQSVSFGQVRFGPEIARLIVGQNGTTYEPFVNLTGAWRFDTSESVGASGGAALREGFSGRVEGGILVRATSGTSLRIAASADGIGNGAYEAYGIQGWLNIPIR